MKRSDLERIRDLAVERLSTGSEPPWVWYQLMKLREASEALIEGMDATRPMEDLPQPDRSRGTGLRLVAVSDPQETAQRHPDKSQVRLPT